MPGSMVLQSPVFTPPILKGIKLHPENPLRFDFIVDSGTDPLDEESLKEESTKLIKYFLASLTIPEDDLWVNLSPYESDRIIPDEFGKTEMGKDLLAQDYMLKQLTASLIYPEDNLGEEFWDKVYQKAYELYGTTDIPVNTFNKVWVIPDKAAVHVNGDVVFVVDAHLKVMLESDYLALSHNLKDEKTGTDRLAEQDVEQLNNVSLAVVNEVIIPAIEKEVNEGKNFAPLRQVYYSHILATWYKRNLKESLLTKVYADQKKILGVDVENVGATGQSPVQYIYAQYIEAFKRGVYDYIKEDYDQRMKEIIPRRYFSGGVKIGNARIDNKAVVDAANIANVQAMLVSASLTGTQRTQSWEPPAGSPYKVLDVVEQGRITAKGIQEQLGMAFSTLQHDIGALVKREIIRRVEGKADQPDAIYEVTAEASPHIAEIKELLRTMPRAYRPSAEDWKTVEPQITALLGEIKDVLSWLNDPSRRRRNYEYPSGPMVSFSAALEHFQFLDQLGIEIADETFLSSLRSMFHVLMMAGITDDQMFKRYDDQLTRMQKSKQQHSLQNSFMIKRLPRKNEVKNWGQQESEIALSQSRKKNNIFVWHGEAERAVNPISGELNEWRDLFADLHNHPKTRIPFPSYYHQEDKKGNISDLGDIFKTGVEIRGIVAGEGVFIFNTEELNRHASERMAEFIDIRKSNILIAKADQKHEYKNAATKKNI